MSDYDSFDSVGDANDTPDQPHSADDERMSASLAAGHGSDNMDEQGRFICAAQKTVMRTRFDKDNSFLLVDDSDVLTRPSHGVTGTFGRKDPNVRSCLPDYAKNITAELDSDDELMMTMRDKGYTGQQIADRLAKEGRIRYDRKSIATRIGQIKLAQAAHVDMLLLEDYKEWPFEEDTLLMQAYELAGVEVSYELEKARAWRFRKVSEIMRRLNREAIVSAKACQERYRALIAGTATIPSDLDDDPEQRRRELKEYRESRERAREAELLEREKKAELERKIKEEARLHNA
ncbi:hypothetical protein K469DRAFT_697041 [Zopfia rhizophila CBS 207.26]|uniref:DUF7626 domain-containing protein n=1 Tax=Zopfia rhizophila CBS 207.26 TaxID=1314779 RepID=A0A6A6EI54_9PEZI|nr:hypothetical protein K469DRAFT_697041 [Zopfia rhizophila CBS 207.26]